VGPNAQAVDTNPDTGAGPPVADTQMSLSLTHVSSSCPVSLDLARPHLGDLRRATLAETPFRSSSHSTWPLSAILSAVSHSIWPVMAILSVASHPIWPMAWRAARRTAPRVSYLTDYELADRAVTGGAAWCTPWAAVMPCRLLHKQPCGRFSPPLMASAAALEALVGPATVRGSRGR
jgi:hypothetical protein